MPVLSRAIPGGGISSERHELLDTLAHALVEDAFTELTYVGKQLTAAATYATAAKVLLIRDSTMTYVGKQLTQTVRRQYDGAGVLLVTLTTTMTYAGKQLVSTSTVRA